ncbi:MAG: hypothetical protein ACXVBE_17570, partial [Bdellovibrionota bacterium]
MRSKLLVSLIVAGIFAVGGGLLYLAHHRSSFPEEQASAPVSVPARPITEEVRKFRAAPPVERVKEFYKLESARVGAVDPDPKLTEQRLKDVAAELSAEEIVWLKAQVMNEKEGADARFFAAYLLALSNKDDALPALKEIALSPLPNSKDQGTMDLARQVRAQAIEGICKFSQKSEARDAAMDIEQKQND